MNITLLTVWPTHADYPIFRRWLERNRNKFHHCIMALSDAKHPRNISNDLKQLFVKLKVQWTDPPTVGGTDDWRSKAINSAYYQIKGDWILFMEQDFFIKDKALDLILLQAEKYDGIVYKEGERLHPAFLLVRKSIADKTSKDFAVVRDKFDHFYTFIQEIMKMGKIITLNDIGLKNNEDYYHMSGLTQNYHMFSLGQTPTHLNEFLQYNYYCMDVISQVEPFYYVLCQINQKLGRGIENQITSFFK